MRNTASSAHPCACRRGMPCLRGKRLQAFNPIPEDGLEFKLKKLTGAVHHQVAQHAGALAASRKTPPKR